MARLQREINAFFFIKHKGSREPVPCSHQPSITDMLPTELANHSRPRSWPTSGTFSNRPCLANEAGTAVVLAWWSQLKKYCVSLFINLHSGIEKVAAVAHNDALQRPCHVGCSQRTRRRGRNNRREKNFRLDTERKKIC